MDDGPESSISTNVPTGALKPTVQVTGSAADVQGFMIDRFDCSIFNLMR